MKKIINPYSDPSEPLEFTIRQIDDKILTDLAQRAFSCTKKTETFNLRDELYASKYNPKGLEEKEKELEAFLKSVQHLNIRTEIQTKEYNWVKINTENMGNINWRFYIAPDPNKMHEMVKKLVEIFYNQNVPVRFKYQLTTKMENCDRIIIYSDTPNKDKVENAIKCVYQYNSSLFNGCERSSAWLYNTSIPGVYIAPETPGEAYSNRVAYIIFTANMMFRFLYKITDSNPTITFYGKDADKALENMKIFITSLMLKYGILLTEDGRRITIDDKNIISVYDYETGILKNFLEDERGYFEAQFFPTVEGRKALLKNFYEVSTIQPQAGLAVRYLTPAQREEERKKILMPHQYSQSNKNNHSSGVPKR